MELQRFHAMSGFIEAQTCRRQVVLNYFAEYTQDACGNCDICLDPPSQFDATEPAQKVLSCVYRINQKGDITHVIDVLRGEKTPKMIQLDHQQVSTFGIGSNKPASYWFAIIRQLIHLGYLQQDISNDSALCLTEASRIILKATEPLMLAAPSYKMPIIGVITKLKNNTTKRYLLNYVVYEKPLLMPKILLPLLFLTIKHYRNWHECSHNQKWKCCR